MILVVGGNCTSLTCCQLLSMYYKLILQYCQRNTIVSLLCLTIEFAVQSGATCDKSNDENHVQIHDIIDRKIYSVGQLTVYVVLF
jgi:hypothetical protein